MHIQLYKKRFFALKEPCCGELITQHTPLQEFTSMRQESSSFHWKIYLSCTQEFQTVAVPKKNAT